MPCTPLPYQVPPGLLAEVGGKLYKVCPVNRKNGMTAALQILRRPQALASLGLQLWYSSTTAHDNTFPAVSTPSGARQSFHAHPCVRALLCASAHTRSFHRGWASLLAVQSFWRSVFMLQPTPILTGWCLSASPCKAVLAVDTRLIEI
jgi:hypothetical protein